MSEGDDRAAYEEALGEVFGRSLSEVMTQCVVDSRVDGAAVAILSDDARTRDLLYATDAAAARIDELQFTLGEGPCLQAFIRGSAQLEVDIADATASSEWPTFSSEVRGELGVSGVFAFPLFSGGARLGVLELYRRRREPFTASQLSTSTAAADALAHTITEGFASNSARFDQSSYRQPQGPFRFMRADVNIAAGMLAARMRIPISEAFVRLRAHAYSDSRSISSLAYDIVRKGASIDDGAATA